MLTALSLGNFKAFASPVRIPIRPITLVFGANSSGKSSLIHGLALGHEVLRRKRFDIQRTTLGGDSIDLGGFRQYVHRKSNALDGRVTWGIEIDGNSRVGMTVFDELLGMAPLLVLSTFGLPLDDQGRPFPGVHPELVSFQLDRGKEIFLRMSLRADGALHVDGAPEAFIGYIRQFAKATATVRSEGPWTADLQDAIETVAADPTGLLPTNPRYIGFGATKKKLAWQLLLHALESIFVGLGERLKAELNRLSYLGPLRSYPPRHLAFKNDHDDANWIAGGGRAWDRMRRDKLLRKAINRWLSSEKGLQAHYKLVVRRYINPRTAQQAIGVAVDEMLEQLRDDHDDEVGLSRWDRDRFIELVTRRLSHDGDAEGDKDLVLIDKRTGTTVSHRDVGIGISQVLPVLVEAYGREKYLIAIEQPEIHLHPRLQAELADVFIDSALGSRRNTFLLETHSEHLILRVMRRIRETTEGKIPDGMPAVRAEDVAVLSVVSDKAGARMAEIPITPDGEFGAPWPGGFFPERMKELY